MNALRRGVALALVGLVFTACANRPDPVAADMESARERTGPPGGRIVSSYSLRRDGHSARARWEIESEMTWSAYAAWVEARLAEYRVAERGEDRVRFLRQLEGDAYTLVLVSKAGAKSLAIEASFEATSF